MLAPALPDVARDLGLNEETTQLTLSIYTLAYCVGPLILAPLSELYGRRPVWLICGSVYVVFNTVCGFAKNNATMIAARFLAGIGASAEFAVSG
jgi:MFS family permease